MIPAKHFNAVSRKHRCIETLKGRISLKSSGEFKQWLTHLPNKLTLARIAAIPILLVFHPFDIFVMRFLSATVFLIAALTDFFDGYLARKYQLETRIGALLDPIADKLLTTTGIILLVAKGNLYFWMAVLLIGRDIAISGIRMIALERNLTISVNNFGKLKTSALVFGIFALMIKEKTFNFPFQTAGMLCMWIGLGLSLYSAYLYCKQFWQSFKSEF